MATSTVPRSQQREPLECHYIKVNGLRMFVRESAQTPSARTDPLVCVHGLNVSSRHDIPFAEEVAPYVRVYTPDQPGYGKSDGADHLLDIHELADWLAAWARAEGIERAAWIGSSFGTQVLTDLAVRHPTVVSRAILVSPTVEPTTRHYPLLARLWWKNKGREAEGVESSTLSEYRDTGLHRIFFTFRQMVRDRIEDRLPHMRMPVLVVRGGSDAILSPQWFEEVMRLLPKARMVTIPGAAHAVNMDAPWALAAAVLPFLTGARDWDAEERSR
jgi:2-hydroxy-6-oxonona-2,4-dienedioate hydrolase